jgi:hypothetical protein
MTYRERRRRSAAPTAGREEERTANAHAARREE